MRRWLLPLLSHGTAAQWAQYADIPIHGTNSGTNKWRGVTALVHGLGARRARMHWMERGLADRGPGAIPQASAHK